MAQPYEAVCRRPLTDRQRGYATHCCQASWKWKSSLQKHNINGIMHGLLSTENDRKMSTHDAGVCCCFFLQKMLILKP